MEQTPEDDEVGLDASLEPQPEPVVSNNEVEEAGFQSIVLGPAPLNAIVRNGRRLAQIEVVLPRWQEIRLHKSRQVASQSQQVGQPTEVAQVVNNGVHSGDVERIKAEPVEDVKQLVALERLKPTQAAEALHDAVEELRNVSL